VLQLVAPETPDDKDLREIQHSQKRFQLAKLLHCTEAMLMCAQKGDWESVEEMENSRKAEITACFSDQNHEETPLCAEALATLIYLNEQIATLVQRAKQELMSARQNLQNGRSAVRIYQNNQ